MRSPPSGNWRGPDGCGHAFWSYNVEGVQIGPMEVVMSVVANKICAVELPVTVYVQQGRIRCLSGADMARGVEGSGQFGGFGTVAAVEYHVKAFAVQLRKGVPGDIGHMGRKGQQPLKENPLRHHPDGVLGVLLLQPEHQGKGEHKIAHALHLENKDGRLGHGGKLEHFHVMMDCCGAPPQRIFTFGRGL